MNSEIPTKTICAWCGAHMAGDPKITRISHGMCTDCEAKENAKLDEQDRILSQKKAA